MFNLNIQKNIPLAPLTTFKIGGPAKFFCEVASEEELIEAVEYAKDNKLAIFVLGGGSNILVSDEGFDGLVIRIQDTIHKIQDTKLECGAGLFLSEAVKLAKENSLSGLEWAAGIPGTIGGAVRGNAGAYGFDMNSIVSNVKVLVIDSEENGSGKEIQSSKFKTFTNKECNFDYRGSVFKENKNLIILSCVLELRKGDQAEIGGKMRDIVKKRMEKIPKDPSPGSFFQNPTVQDGELIKKFERDTGCVCRNKKIPAGWLIDEAGLRGKKMGGVAVSEKHGNFVINLGAGKAQDVVMLASLIKMKIRDEFGVQLKEEIQYVGF